MPTTGQWVKFLGSAGFFLGTGVYVSRYIIPTDEQIIDKLSPELKARYLREKDIRHRAQQILQEEVAKNPDKPVWLQGGQKMREFEYKIAERARKEIEAAQGSAAVQAEREKLRELAEKEKKL